MRSRVAALIAVLGIAVVPASSGAAEPISSSGPHVSVKPASGGQVWSVLLPPCPVGKACPAILRQPRLVARFTFRVVRG